MLAYLWHRDQSELLKEMIDCKIQAIIIKVAALGKYFIEENHYFCVLFKNFIPVYYGIYFH